jgi:hypothetical protein
MISAKARPSLKLFHVVSAAVALAAFSLKADMIELINGDHYRGKVVSMDSNNVDFISEIQGRVHLPRNKVAQITFHEVVARPVAGTNAPAGSIILSGPSAAAPVVAPLVLSRGSNSAVTAPAGTGPASAEAVVAQMRKEGIQPQLINQVQEQIFGKASPEASQKFEEIMGGLMSGQISVQDLRGQARNAIQQARDAKRDLGGDAGEMLDGYIAILEKFVNETDPSTTASAPATTPPAATK